MKIVTKEKLLRLQAKLADNVLPEHWQKILVSDDQGESKIFSDDDFDENRAPLINAGLSICMKCGRMYWVTPADDAMVINGKADLGKFCEPCFYEIIGIKELVTLIIQ